MAARLCLIDLAESITQSNWYDASIGSCYTFSRSTRLSLSAATKQLAKSRSRQIFYLSLPRPMIKHLPFLTTALLLFAPSVCAQTYQPSNRIPVADSTLGTQVSGNGNNFNITGGVARGQTLFQSFTDFSVPTNGQANFVNPVGNRDIITRVTGKSFSDLNGTVNTNGANFFLINPNGIVFGTNAQLNVGKAFVGSTASSLDLVDGGGRTITFGTNPNGDAPLLSVAPNVLFDVSRLNFGGGTGAINNFGTLQTLNNSQYIGLIGGNVTFDGSSGGGNIIAPGGRVDLGGLSGAGSVSIDNNGLVSSSSSIGRSNVVLTDGAAITVRATGTLAPVSTFVNNATSNGSSINISANNVTLLNAGASFAALDAGLGTNSGVQTQAAGNINIDVTGKVSVNNSVIKNTLRPGSEAKIGDINIQAGALDVINNSEITTISAGKGDGGGINIKTTGDIKVSGYDPASNNLTQSTIDSGISGQGDGGKISIDTQGKLSVIDGGAIYSSIYSTGIGNGKGITIAARELELANNSFIFTDTSSGGRGNAGDIDLKTIGDIKISGYDSSSTSLTRSQITSNVAGSGDTGKITIATQGKLSIINNGGIASAIEQTGVGNSKGISITARELSLANSSFISASTAQADRVSGKGNAGDINIQTTGDIQISGSNLASAIPDPSQNSSISSDTSGQGDTGKITIATQGKLFMSNFGSISNSIAETGVGNSKGIAIDARELELANNSFIFTDTLSGARGNAGDINIKTTGDIKISGIPSSDPLLKYDPSIISSNTFGRGDPGKITIDTQGKLSIVDGGTVSSSIGRTGVGNSRGISIDAGEINLTNSSSIATGTLQTVPVAGTGKAGDIALNIKGAIQASNFAQILSSSDGAGQTGNISIASDKLLLNNSIVRTNGVSVSGGNIAISLSDKFLMRNDSSIFTVSSSSQNNNGGNITIGSPLIIALPGNNDINANANRGNGGNVNIVSQGLFDLQYRPTRQASSSTNDITASSTFGQNGTVNINTPGIDPGKDSTELPKTTIDASNQISQACSANNRQNKLIVTGRGGIPPNANDPLVSEAWQDPRATNIQPAIASVTTDRSQLPPPAVSWVFDGKGKVTLIAAGTAGQSIGTRVVCPDRVGK
jgi:filamentous hemagglutinin family protein